MVTFASPSRFDLSICVCHHCAFDGVQVVIRLHSEAQMEWDAKRQHKSTNPQIHIGIWKINAVREQNLSPSLGPAQMYCDRDPRLNYALFWAAWVGMQWNSGRAEEETGLPTKSAARLWVQWVPQCTCFPLSDSWFGDFRKKKTFLYRFSWGITLPHSQVCSSDWHILAYLGGGQRLVAGFRDHLLQWNSCLAGLKQRTECELNILDKLRCWWLTWQWYNDVHNFCGCCIDVFNLQYIQ